MKYPPCHRRAFSLIELLVILAIIAVLAALLFPVAGKMRQVGAETKTVSNLRSLGALMQLFAADHDGFFPWAFETGPEASGGRGTWKYRLLDHVGLLSEEGRKIMETPAAPMVPKLAESGNFLATGFTANVAVLGNMPNPANPADPGVPRIKAVNLPSPARQIMLATGGQGNWDNSAPTSMWTPWVGAASPNPPDQQIPASARQTTYGGLGFWIKGGAAVLMVDGHIEILKPDQVVWRNLQRGL